MVCASGKGRSSRQTQPGFPDHGFKSFFCVERDTRTTLNLHCGGQGANVGGCGRYEICKRTRRPGSSIRLMAYAFDCIAEGNWIGELPTLPVISGGLKDRF